MKNYSLMYDYYVWQPKYMVSIMKKNVFLARKAAIFHKISSLYGLPLRTLVWIFCIHAISYWPCLEFLGSEMRQESLMASTCFVPLNLDGWISFNVRHTENKITFWCLESFRKIQNNKNEMHNIRNKSKRRTNVHVINMMLTEGPVSIEKEGRNINCMVKQIK